MQKIFFSAPNDIMVNIDHFGSEDVTLIILFVFRSEYISHH